MAFARQQRRHIGHAGSPRSPRGRKHNNLRWLSTSIYAILGLMVIHLMLSEGDPVPTKKMKGKTTKKRKEANEVGGTKSASNNKKLPSYRQKDILGEGSLFNNKLPFEETTSRIAKPVGTIELQKSNEMGNLETATDANLDEGEGSNNLNVQEEARNEGGASKASGESEEDAEEAEEELTSEELAGNVQHLKADVDGVHLHLRNTAEESMRSSAADLDEELEGHKSEISTLLRPITQKYFDDEATLKLEELVFDRLSDSILIAMRDSVELFLADMAVDLDVEVADKEQEGMDLMEISGFLEDWEADQVPDVQAEVEKIANSLKATFAFSIPEKARETVEKVFEKLDHTVTLELNTYGQLTMEPQIEIDFSEEQAQGAIVKVLAEDADQSGGAVLQIAGDYDEGGGNEGVETEEGEENSEDGNEEGEGNADEQVADGEEEVEDEDGNEEREGDADEQGVDREEEVEDKNEADSEDVQDVETVQRPGGNGTVGDAAAQVAAQDEEWQIETPQVESAAGNATTDEFPLINQPANGQGIADPGFEQGIGTEETEEDNNGGASEWGGTQQAVQGGFDLGEDNGSENTQQAADKSNLGGGIEAAENAGGKEEFGEGNTEGGEEFGEDSEGQNLQVNVEGGEAVGAMGRQSMEGAEETEQADIGGVMGESVQAGGIGGGEEAVGEDAEGVGSTEQAGAEKTIVFGGGEVSGGETTEEGTGAEPFDAGGDAIGGETSEGVVEGTEQSAAAGEVTGGAEVTDEAPAGGAGEQESNSGDDDDEEAD